ncbi:MAG: ABC transporter substrate-binding protein [Prevotella sp.]|nr:ABC transporter substrate-binding protein [Prevotella sp.]
MLKVTKHALCAMLLLIVLTACGGQRAPQSWAERLQQTPAPDSLTFRYARLIHVEQQEGCRVVYIDNPWQPGKGLHTYVLVPYGAALPHALPAGTVVRTPLRRSVVFTSVHCALIEQLHATAQVAGVADLKYIKVPFVQEGVKAGSITDCGDGMSPVVETIIDTEADAILLSPFENAGGYGRMENIGIPIIECAEYMEASPLARAEWVRFYGMLFGQEEEAERLFTEVESHYMELKQQAATASCRPSVLVDKMAGSVWYVPGGRSTIGQMLSDANADYPWADDDHGGSLQLAFETVLERAGQSDAWLLRYDSPTPLTLPQLLSEKDGYRMVKATQSSPLASHLTPPSGVYGCNVTTSLFYEETPFRPDLLLQDFIKILHPDIPNLPPLRYYHRIE